MTVISAALLLFLVMDPVGNIPFFISTLKDIAPRRRRIIILRECLFALIVLIAFLFGGQYILRILQISEPALTIAGGIILFLIALRMIFPFGRANDDELEGEPFLVPLAIPFIAGPSALATVMLIMSSDTSRWQEWLLALGLAWFASGLVLFIGTALSGFLGARGLIAIERLMGMVLTTIAVQMMMDGIVKFMA